MTLNDEFYSTAYEKNPRKLRTCRYCGKQFTSQQWASIHRRMKHDKEVKRY